MGGYRQVRSDWQVERGVWHSTTGIGCYKSCSEYSWRERCEDDCSNRFHAGLEWGQKRRNATAESRGYEEDIHGDSRCTEQEGEKG